jgi:Zn-dependent protease/CBS domain-containing protein
MTITSGFRLATIAGIDIAIDWSLLIIFTLITVVLATSVFPAWHPGWGLLLCWGTAFMAAVLFFASVLTHELSHSLVGRANGITVRRITLFVFGGMAQMENEPPTWRAELAMTVVGPLTSLVLGFLFLWIGGVLAGPVSITPENAAKVFADLNPGATLFMWLGQVNILLGLFNLVPGFPLDGGRVLRALLWAVTGDLNLATLWASRGGRAFAWLLIGTGFAMILGVHVPVFGGGSVNGLWLAFIGWFLNNAAVMSYEQLRLRDALQGVAVFRLMQTQLTRMAPRTTVEEVIEKHVMESGQRVFPVEDEGRFIGLASLRDLQGVATAARAQTPVSECMTPLERLVTVTPDTDSISALTLLGSANLNQLPVVDQGRCVGMVRREDILKWLSLHMPSAVKRHA